MKIVAVFNDFRLRSKLEVFAFMPKIERLLAQTVASTYHYILTTVVDYVGEHAVEELHRIDTQLLVHGTDHLCVALCSQYDIAQILFLQFKVVVHLTVEDDADIVIIYERLVAARVEVDDRETHMSECQLLAIRSLNFFHARMIGTTEVHQFQLMFYNATLITSRRSENSTHFLNKSLINDLRYHF